MHKCIVQGRFRRMHGHMYSHVLGICTNFCYDLHYGFKKLVQRFMVQNVYLAPYSLSLSLSLSLCTLNLYLKLEVEELYNAGSVITLVGELITPALSLQLSASSHHRMASKTVLLVLGLLLPLITTRVSSADNEEKLILKAPYAEIPTPAPVKAPAPATVPVKAPPTPAPVTKTPPPLPPVTKPPPTLPPVPKPLPPPLPPVAKPPPTVPPVTPPASPPLPPVRSKAGNHTTHP
ncbi:hypothetical protein EUGRSUZ_I01835 [Eucalyptus grandis]|uniref:Uncharacterized protein n=2 Tax=Eucalyptus grandis TaxID=71139 RepID=A0ACC3JGN7_EUCGR|nr:hypothetical protein EUGRSUZ_I01835 [Eucalyptus grandis]